jgi:hypothetical protein
MELEKLYNRVRHPAIFYEKEELDNLNCGSFALGVDSWYCPYIDEDDDINEDDELWQYTETARREWIEELVQEGVPREEIIMEVLDRDFEFILKTCPWLEQIGPEDINEKDRVIAYRLSFELPSEREDFDLHSDTDYHFQVQIDGQWWEKNGICEVHRVPRPDANEPWIVDKYLKYDGEIRYARFRKGEQYA